VARLNVGARVAVGLTSFSVLPNYTPREATLKPLKLLFLSLVAILPFASPASVRTQTRVPKADTQSWNDVQLTVPLNQKVDFLLQGTVRIGGNLTTAVDERWGFGFNYKAWKYVTLNELYFHREAKPPNGRQEREDRLSLGATVRFPLGKFTLSNRNWFERRWREPQVDAWRLVTRCFMTGACTFGCGTGSLSAPAMPSTNISLSTSMACGKMTAGRDRATSTSSERR
jgi:hypothetical protein